MPAFTSQLLVFIIITFFCTSLVAQNASIIVQSGHSDGIAAQAFDTKNNLLLTGGYDGRIIQWDIERSAQVGTIQTNISKLSCFALSKDGALLAAGGYDNAIVLIDYPNNKVLKKWVPFKYAVNDVAFSPDGQYLVAASSDRTLWVYQIKSGAIQTAMAEDDLYALSIAPDSKTVYAACRSGAVYKTEISKALSSNPLQTIYQSDEQITAMSLSPSGNLLALGTSGSYKDDKAINGQLIVMQMQGSKEVLSGEFDFSMSIGRHYQTIQWRNDSTLYYINKSDSLFALNIYSRQKQPAPHSSVLHFSLDPVEGWLAVPGENDTRLFRNNSTVPFRTFKGQTVSPQRIWLNNQQNLVVEYANGFKEWNLKLAKMLSVEDKLEPATQHSYSISHNGKFTVRNNVRYGMQVRNNENGEEEEDFYTPLDLLGQEIVRSQFSPSDKYLAVITKQHQLFILETAKEFATKSGYDLNLSNMAELDVPKLIFSPDESKLALLDKSILLFNIDNGEGFTLDANRNALYANLAATFSKDSKHFFSASHQVYSLDEPPGDTTNLQVVYVPPGATQANEFYLIQEPGRILQWDAANGKLLSTRILPFKDGRLSDATAMAFSDDGNVLYIGTSDNRVLKFDQNGKVLQAVEDHHDMVTSIHSIPGTALLATGSNDGTIKLRNTNTLMASATLFALQNHGYIVIDSGNHYKRSRNGAQAVLFQKDKQVFQPEQFDLLFNQPHLVLKSIGLADEELIAAHQLLYERKLKASSGSISKESIHSPLTVTIYNEKMLEAVTSSKIYELNVQVTCSNNPAVSLQAFVNGIPVLNGSAGQPLNIAAHATAVQKIKVPLARGNNIISVKAIDNTGIASFEKKFNVLCQPQEIIRPNLYVFTVSVSNYKDSNLNLRYAVKDGKDFMQVWKKDGKKTLGFPSQFGKIFDYTFFDQQAVNSNILAIKDSLKQAKEEDMVILYFSGHGMLDDKKDFWYATWDIDAANPGGSGLSYRQMESLLDSIAPRRKLLLLDACHSGEVDKTQLAEIASGPSQTGARSSIKKYKYKEPDGMKNMGNVFELMQEMFNSFNKGTGTVVISAAAGDSYALESEKWNNGVFTYALINGLTTKAADINKDGDINIAELSSYVTRQVSLLTNGMQKPTERQENTENNYRIW